MTVPEKNIFTQILGGRVPLPSPVSYIYVFAGLRTNRKTGAAATQV